MAETVLTETTIVVKVRDELRRYLALAGPEAEKAFGTVESALNRVERNAKGLGDTHAKAGNAARGHASAVTVLGHGFDKLTSGVTVAKSLMHGFIGGLIAQPIFHIAEAAITAARDMIVYGDASGKAAEAHARQETAAKALEEQIRKLAVTESRRARDSMLRREEGAQGAFSAALTFDDPTRTRKLSEAQRALNEEMSEYEERIKRVGEFREQLFDKELYGSGVEAQALRDLKISGSAATAVLEAYAAAKEKFDSAVAASTNQYGDLDPDKLRLLAGAAAVGGGGEPIAPRIEDFAKTKVPTATALGDAEKQLAADREHVRWLHELATANEVAAVAEDKLAKSQGTAAVALNDLLRGLKERASLAESTIDLTGEKDPYALARRTKAAQEEAELRSKMKPLLSLSGIQNPDDIVDAAIADLRRLQTATREVQAGEARAAIAESVRGVKEEVAVLSVVESKRANLTAQLAAENIARRASVQITQDEARHLEEQIRLRERLRTFETLRKGTGDISTESSFALLGERQAFIERALHDFDQIASRSIDASDAELAAMREARKQAAETAFDIGKARQFGDTVGSSFASSLNSAVFERGSLGDKARALGVSIGKAAFDQGIAQPAGKALADAVTKAIIGEKVVDVPVQVAHAGAMGALTAVLPAHTFALLALAGIKAATLGTLATGGVVEGAMGAPFKSFAYGGVATSPTLAYFAEKKGMAEAFVPLPDGKRIPVKMDVGEAQPVIHITVQMPVEAIDTNDFDGRLEDRANRIADIVARKIPTRANLKGAVRHVAGGSR